MIWGELILTLDSPFAMYNSSNPFSGYDSDYEEATVFQAVLAFDRQQYIKFLLDSNEGISTGMGRAGRNDKQEYILGGCISTEYMDWYVKSACSFGNFPKERSYVIKLKIDFRLTNTLTFTLGGHFYGSPNFTDAVLGSKGHNDEIYLHTKLTF